jgi:hypothetical protein
MHFSGSRQTPPRAVNLKTKQEQKELEIAAGIFFF